MWGVIPTSNTNFSSPIRDLATLPPNSDLLYAMVTCHTLTIIREKLCGDPMDLKVRIECRLSTIRVLTRTIRSYGYLRLFIR